MLLLVDTKKNQHIQIKSFMLAETTPIYCRHQLGCKVFFIPRFINDNDHNSGHFDNCLEEQHVSEQWDSRVG